MTYPSLSCPDISRVLSGAFPFAAPTFRIAGQIFRFFYFLSVGTFPRWRIFAQTLSDSVAEKDKAYVKAQEGVGKCIERVFGLLFRQCRIMFVAKELWTATRMKSIATAHVILHNMTVELRDDQGSLQQVRWLWS